MALLTEEHADGPGPLGPRGGSRRTVARRASLPSGRVVTGALLIAAAAVVTFGAWLTTTHHGAGHREVVAGRPLAAGTTLTPDDLTQTTMRLPPATEGHAFTSAAPLLGRTLAAPLAPGELVQSSDLVPGGTTPAVRPVTLSATATDVADLAVGDLVDVVVTNGSTPSAATNVVVRGARVLQVQSAGGGLTSGTGPVVVIGVANLDQVTAVIHAERTGTVNLVVGEPADGTGGAGGGGAGGAGNQAAGGGAGGGS